MAKLHWRANDGPQTDFLWCETREVLFGGARGGGKSEAIAPKALIHVKQYGAAASVLILRETFPQLIDLMDRTRPMFLAAGAKWHEQRKTWRFPSGARVRFGHTSDGCDPYWGQEFSLIVIDELTRTIADEREYHKLLGSLRSSRGVPCQVVCTSNPGGKGHAWVKARFMGVPSQTVYKDPETGLERVFIASSLADNPYLGADYRATLEAMPEAERKAYLYGDWDAFEGQVFSLQLGVHLVEPAPIPDHWPRFRAMDWGFAKPFCVLWGAVDDAGHIHLYREWYGVAKDGKGGFIANEGARLEPGVVAERIAGIEADAKEDCIGIADPACWAKGQGDHGGGPSIVEAMRAKGVHWQAGKNDRLQGKMQVHNRLFYDEHTPPALVIHKGACPHLVRTLPALEYDAHRVEDVDTDGEDHCLVGETIVHTADGSRPIAKLVGTSGLVWSWDNGPILKPYTDCRRTQQGARVYEVRLADGRAVTATINHPFLLTTGEWVCVRDLRPGDEVQDVGLRGMIPSGVYGGNQHECNGDFAHGAGVSGRAVLPVWSLLPEEGAAPASPGVGVGARPDSEGLARAPQGPQSSEQFAGQSGAGAGCGAPEVSHQHAHLQAGEACAYAQGDAAEGGRMARLGSGSGVARAAREEYLGVQGADAGCVPGVRCDVRDAVSVAGEVLRGQVPQQGQDSTRESERAGVQITEIVAAGCADVYNLEVADTHCFAVNGGLVVHNCYDALRYLLMARPWGPAPKKKPDGWRDRQNAPQRNWEWG